MNPKIFLNSSLLTILDILSFYLLSDGVYVGDGGVVFVFRHGVVTRLTLAAAQMTLAIVPLQDPKQFAIHGIMVISICSQQDYFSRLPPPPQSLFAFHDLISRVITQIN